MKTLTKGILGILSSSLLAGCTCHRQPVSLDQPRAKAVFSKAEAEAGGMATVYYAFDRYDLSAESKVTLRENAAWMKSNSNTAIKVEGHTDERGTLDYNMVLGEKRADSAYSYLKSLGIPEKQISTVSYGEELPADAGHNEEAWSRNRRVEFKLRD